ncbi:M48 family metalloprotease [Candidatus Parcubacteria bacterium]|nr:M48 family metalloprotease [Candidatus Parcubacteria bacterium]
MVINFYEQIEANKRRTLVIISFFVLFITLVAYVLGQASDGGSGWLLSGFLISGVSGAGSYFWGDKFVLAVSRARPAIKKDFFEYFTVVENLSIGAGIPMPKLYVIDDSAPNAFATGRDPQHAVVCATTGLLSKLDRTELEGVIAHELSHIKNYDIRLMLITTVLVGTVVLLSDWFRRAQWFRSRDRNRSQVSSLLVIVGLLVAVLAPLVGKLVQLALSRQREFLADASAVALTRQPEGLAQALEKLASDREPLEAANRATAPLYITNPLKGPDWSKKAVNLFSTHPPIEERIRRLRQM